MAVSRSIYVSAVSEELGSARELVARNLRSLGYQPVWKELDSRADDDVRPGLFSRVEECAGVIQIVGRSYGPEPPVAAQRSGRTSYAQYEALSARQCNIPVWHFITGEGFPVDAPPTEDAEHQRLQTTYQMRVQHHARHWRPVSNQADLEKRIRRLRGSIFMVRRAGTLKRAAVFLLVAGGVAYGSYRWQQRPVAVPRPTPIAVAIPAAVHHAKPAQIARSSSADSLARKRAAAVEFRTLGRLAEAEAELRDILETRERFLGADHADVIETCQDLALVLRDRGKREQALAFARRVEAVVKRNPATDAARLREIDELVASITGTRTVAAPGQ